MSEEEVKQLVSLRQHLVEKYSRVKDYRQNKNAIMREWDHAELVHETIVKLDNLLKEYVNFETK
tara:strand:+ start:303 stop:494 length:192 start_codon:yes stop_codon:yes gene_type:complete